MIPMPCPCRSGKDYSQCCQPLHDGQPAASPEALMRSRFSAFAMGKADYLLRSWHPGTRPDNLSLDDKEHWVGLTIINASEDSDRGKVHFQAVSQEPHGFTMLEEISNFVREEGHWFYVDGETSVSVLKPGRNDPCLCGSGKKFKKCCA
ncbi:YchJ family protein [Alcanivorax sp. S6407]|uniref:YchJ family protein n=1 Tax=Alcanivorax sp. S6407 TaxID=2926424 RepID=UPI001FF3E5DC|nr:YchJ family protein [Alcanivorax sp. S6407]MCK0154129.1 YchJ family protein [Alcanivorax sp. S6407]